MKRVLLLGLSLLLLTQVALAFPAGLAVRSERGLPFRLRLDGYRIGGRGGMTQVRFDRLAPGVHWADFQLPANGGVLNYRTQIQLIPGRESRFVLVTRRGYPPVLRRVDEIPLPGWVGGRWQGPGRPDDYGYQSQPTPFDGPTTWSAPGGRDDWDGRNDTDGAYDNGPVPGGNGSYGPPPAGGGYNNGPGQYGQLPAGDYGNGPAGGSYGSNTGYRYYFAGQDVNQLLQAMKARSFDDQKVLLAKQALAESSIGSDDLRRLLAGIDFDRGRLELAKFAYAHVADRQNFYRVYDVFTFDASVREMQQYIEQNQGQ